MKVCCISDTHGHLIELPKCDLLIHAGDLTGRGTPFEVERALSWLHEAPAAHVVTIAGNHDFLFERDPQKAREVLGRFRVIYLQDSGIEIEGHSIWGSPFQPWFYDWAFNFAAEAKAGRDQASRTWAKIPVNTEILITHGPPRDILDRTARGETVGCPHLLERIKELPHLKYHVFGHIHEGYGMRERDGVTYINACTCTLKYQPTNPPVMFDLGVKNEH